MQLAGTSAFADFDLTTFLVIAACIGALFGFFLISTSVQGRTRALTWWGSAYVIGGFAVALWSVEGALSPPLLPGFANALVFVACGMIWSAARLLHGRPVRWGWMSAGAALWLAACFYPDFALSTAARIVLSSIIVLTYMGLTAAELWRERRKGAFRRWPAIFVPILHGAVFLLPVPMASLLPGEDGMLSLAGGWIAILVLELALYLAGITFVALVLSKERGSRALRDIASRDELTGLLNRRGFFSATHQLVHRQATRHEAVSVLIFDLDHFGAISERYGHMIGEEVLKSFAATVSSTLRAGDIVGRFVGEEFVAMLSGNVAEASIAAERVRSTFQAKSRIVAGHQVDATVSVGVASGGIDVPGLITAAAVALDRARRRGGNRVEAGDHVGSTLPPLLEAERLVADSFSLGRKRRMAERMAVP
jgi:diguanylate cyclase (GGDEF)-like protein